MSACTLVITYSDTSIVSFTIALNSAASDGSSDSNNSSSDSNYSFCGGGTWFRAIQESRECVDGLDNCKFSFSGVVDAAVGQAVLFAGPLRHGGYPVTSGTRFILVVFMYNENFAYQSYLTLSPIANQRDEDVPDTDKGHKGHFSNVSSDDCIVSTCKKTSFVVYRETLELMTTINRNQYSSTMLW